MGLPKKTERRFEKTMLKKMPNILWTYRSEIYYGSQKYKH